MIDKFLFQPVSPFVLNQKFGENKACVTTDGTNRIITCDGKNPPNGFRSLYGKDGHKGLDLRAFHGQYVYCAAPGEVVQIDTDPRSGLDVRVVTYYKGFKYRHIYEHLMSYNVKQGDMLKLGDLIGKADNTGWSSGDHLHFQLEKWQDGRWVAIDPLPLMNDMFAVQATNTLTQMKEQLAKALDFLSEYLRKRRK